MCEDSEEVMEELSTTGDAGSAWLLLIPGRLMSQGSLSLYIFIYNALRLLLQPWLRCGTHEEALNALAGHSEQPCLTQDHLPSSVPCWEPQILGPEFLQVFDKQISFT